MKRAFSVFLVFATVLVCFAFTTSSAYSGTPAEKWYNIKKDQLVEVSTAEQLVTVFNDIKDGEEFARKIVRLTADITVNEGDFNDWEDNPPAYNWMEIVGNGTFSGTFDGNGHTISGIYANGFYGGKDHMPYEDYNGNELGKHNTGLFFSLGGTVKNLRITNSYFTGPYCTSAIAGALTKDSVFENVQVDNTKVFGTYAQVADPTLPDVADESGPYEKHTATGGFVGMSAGDQTKITMTNCVFQGTVVGGGRMLGGLLGVLNLAHVEMNGCGFIGVCESFYGKNYDGVNLFKENSGGLLGRVDDSGENGTVMNDCFFIGSFKANGRSTTSGVFIGRSEKFIADNCWANEDAYDKMKFYDSPNTENMNGKDTDAGMHWEKTGKLTGKDSVSYMGLDDSIFTSVEGVGPMLTAFRPATDHSTQSTKKPAATTGDVTAYMMAAVAVSAAAAVVISKSRTHA